MNLHNQKQATGRDHNERMREGNAKMRYLLTKIERSACLDQRVGNRCICYACEARAILKELA